MTPIKIIEAMGSGDITTDTYSYDAAGRPTSVPVLGSSNRTLVWDYDSHLKTWSAPGGGAAVITNVYKGAGTRVSSTVTGGNTQLDLRSDIGRTDALLQSDNSSVSDVNYVPGIAERRGSTWTYDHSGIKNIDSQSNGSQSVTSTRQYDAFGSVVSSSGSHAGPFGYGGKFGYQEDTAGYKLLGDRWYDPEAGRFLTRDRAHDGRNWYTYCQNNPITHGDPTGYLVDAIADAAFFGWDLADFIDDPSWGGFGMLVIDAAMLLVPFVPNFISPAARAAKVGIKAAKAAEEGETLYRFGKYSERANKLSREAIRAEEEIGLHGVSVNSSTKGKSEYRNALREEVEKHFKVTKTGRDPGHYTVELPKPVTKDVADRFNDLFK